MRLLCAIDGPRGQEVVFARPYISADGNSNQQEGHPTNNKSDQKADSRLHQFLLLLSRGGAKRVYTPILAVKQIILFLLVFSTLPAFAQLRVPSIAYSTAGISAQDGFVYDYPSIGTNPTFQQVEPVIFSPANGVAVIQTGAAPFPNCVRIDGGTPTATTPGTCDAPATTFTFGGSNTLNITGSVTVTAIATGVGQTNSAVATSVITVQPFFPAPGTYSYSPLVITLTGTMGSNLIYTTNGSTPTASGTCTATNGTAGANGTQITLPNAATTPVKFIPCVGGTPGTMQSASYTQRAPITWYVTPTGGTRFSANVTSGLCNGQANTAPSGGSPNQSCAYNDFRYLWDDDSGAVGAGAWVIAGGDTVMVGGCTASVNQINPSNPNCRIGWDNPNGGGSTNLWCQFIGNNICFNPTIPSGSISQPTRILGMNYASCATGGQTNPRNYAPGQLAQLFAGFGLTWSFDLRDTQNVTIGCIEFTTHNGVCVTAGNPAYPRGCSSNPPIDDFAGNGWYLNRNSKISFQDVYTHGFSSSGMFGPFQGVTMLRSFVGFNASAAWQMDDGHTTPNGLLSILNAVYPTMEGNGCSEEYPIVHAFSAQACYDDNSNGFGDALSGQDTLLNTLIWDHGLVFYNTKDAFIGPHPLIKNLTITNSMAYGSSGSQWKFITDTNATLGFFNNLTIGNCNRMSVALPGAARSFGGIHITQVVVTGGTTATFTTAPQSFTAGQTVFIWNFQNSGAFLDGQSVTVLSAGLTSTQFEAIIASATNGTYVDSGFTNVTNSGVGGAYLSDYCRAAGNTMGSNLRSGSTWTTANSTFVGYTGYHMFISCGIAYPNNESCGTSTWNVTNDIFLGFTLAGVGVGPSVVLPTGGPAVTATFLNNIDIFNKPGSGVTCGSGGNICVDPALVSQPIQQSGGWTNVTFLDGFNFNLTSGSPAIGAGITYTGILSTDNAGNTQTSPPVIGGLVFATAPTAHPQSFGTIKSFGSQKEFGP